MFISRLTWRTILCTAVLMAMGLGALPASALAADAKAIDADVDVTLKDFAEKVTGSDDFLKTAKGILVFPAIYKAGFIFGAEYGEGALRINGKTVDYYNTVAGSFGFQIGAEKTALILMFMKEAALEKFRKSAGFELGVDASATLVTVGAKGSLDTTKLAEPILAFVLNQRGLMAGVTLEGAKLTKLDLK